MLTRKQLLLKEIPRKRLSYFELQAYWGITKHMGGLEATKELIELCKINKDKHILDVGCGVGKTTCYIVKRYDCKVMGVDISQSMIERSSERVKREGVEDKVNLIMADAQNLPFKERVFDAVICESVTAFPKDKKRAVNEYARVVKQRQKLSFQKVCKRNIFSRHIKSLFKYLGYGIYVGRK
ncbi:MAG: class I SAM-dependent methyltransferase [Acidobacteriota bacterium]